MKNYKPTHSIRHILTDKLQINVVFSPLNPSLHVLVFDFTKLITIEVTFFFFCRCLGVKQLRGTQKNRSLQYYNDLGFSLFQG